MPGSSGGLWSWGHSIQNGGERCRALWRKMTQSNHSGCDRETGGVRNAHPVGICNNQQSRSVYFQQGIGSQWNGPRQSPSSVES